MKKSFKVGMAAIALMLSTAVATSALAADITGAGSTFVYPILAKWSAAYPGGSKINYQSIGSAAALRRSRRRL